MSILTSWQCVSPEVTVKGFLKSAVYPMQWMGLMMKGCGMAVWRMGMLGESVKIKF
jgi:hypothetical protein